MAMTGDCKSPGVNLRKFESYLRHQLNVVPCGLFLFDIIFVIIIAMATKSFPVFIIDLSPKTLLARPYPLLYDRKSMW